MEHVLSASIIIIENLSLTELDRYIKIILQILHTHTICRHLLRSMCRFSDQYSKIRIYHNMYCVTSNINIVYSIYRNVLHKPIQNIAAFQILIQPWWSLNRQITCFCVYVFNKMIDDQLKTHWKVTKVNSNFSKLFSFIREIMLFINLQKNGTFIENLSRAQSV